MEPLLHPPLILELRTKEGRVVTLGLKCLAPTIQWCIQVTLDSGTTSQAKTKPALRESGACLGSDPSQSLINLALLAKGACVEGPKQRY